MTYRGTVLGFLFLLLALVLAGCEVLGVYEYVREQNASAYILVASCTIALVTPGLPALGDWFWRGRQGLYCLGAWLAFAICLTIVLTAAIQRTGAATDGATQARAAAERATKIAEAAERQAKDDYTAAQSAALTECVVRAKRCMDAEDKAATARATLARARADLVSAPAGVQADPLAARLAGLLRMSEDQFRLMQPLMVPLALSLLSVLFFAGWARLDFTPAPGKPQEAPKAPIVTPAAKPQLALVRPPAAKNGAVAAYLVNRTEPAPGDEVEIERTMYADYAAWCAQVGAAPHKPGPFAQELGGVAKAAGLKIAIRGQQAFCLDRRLVA
jgi:hypothetical protein